MPHNSGRGVIDPVCFVRPLIPHRTVKTAQSENGVSRSNCTRLFRTSAPRPSAIFADARMVFEKQAMQKISTPLRSRELRGAKRKRCKFATPLCAGRLISEAESGNPGSPPAAVTGVVIEGKHKNLPPGAGKISMRYPNSPILTYQFPYRYALFAIRAKFSSLIQHPGCRPS